MRNSNNVPFLINILVELTIRRGEMKKKESRKEEKEEDFEEEVTEGGG